MKSCLDCQYRRIGCHGFCRVYKENKAESEELKKKKFRENEYLRYLTGAEGAYARMRGKRGVMRV